MSVPAVYWHEGMFLRPHHFQAAERHWNDQLRIGGKFDVYYNWGLRAIDIDQDAIRNYRLEVHRLEARFRDGSLLIADREHNPIQGLDLRPVIDKLSPGDAAEILLGVPVLQLGRENASAEAADARYRVDAPREPIPDENTGQNPRLVSYRRLLPRLMSAAQQDTTGYEVIPIVRLERSAQESAPPQVQPWFIPPVLACDAWAPLGDGVIGQVYHRTGNMVKQLAQRVKDQRITFDSNAPEDRKIFERLRALNEGYASFGVIARAAGVHPFLAYLELCRLAGRLAVFGKNTAIADDDLPPYDHDDLGHCFFTVKRFIDELLTQDFDQGYEMRPFIGAGLRMKVQIEPAWLAPAAQLLVGVDSPLTTAECTRLLTAKLNMKIGALERVDEIFSRRLRGLDFVPVPNPPRVLPASVRMAYFQVNRESSREEWDHVAQTYNLAIRLNEGLMRGSIDGRQDVSIQVDGRTITLRFTLYMVPPAAGGSA
ncbi:MAG TPA: type VI secretion system baseplate subunit TssK [Urbifossiella sp.]|nr:type VI secretion system baseplate subunit TssK [Urbifossiella sp.]